MKFNKFFKLKVIHLCRPQKSVFFFHVLTPCLSTSTMTLTPFPVWAVDEQFFVQLKNAVLFPKAFYLLI